MDNSFQDRDETTGDEKASETGSGFSATTRRIEEKVLPADGLDRPGIHIIRS